MIQENRDYFEIEKNGVKSFGILLLVILLSFHLYFVLFKGTFDIYIFSSCFICFIFTFNYPEIFYYPNKIWIQIGGGLSIIVNPIIIGLLFYFIFTPLSLIIRIFKKDLLNTNFNRTDKSYWIVREKKPEPINRQF